MEIGDNLFFRGNATGVSLNVMIFNFCKRELTGLSMFITLINFGDIEKKKKKKKKKKTSVLVIFAFLLRISIFNYIYVVQSSELGKFLFHLYFLTENL